MTIHLRWTTLAVCLAAAARFAGAQSAPALEFEAASLKPSPPSVFGTPAFRSSFTGGPGTPTPTRLTVRNFLLPFLIDATIAPRGRPRSSFW